MAIREVVVEGAENRGITFREHQLAHDLLDNLSGVVLGESAHNHFNLPNAINVAPADDEELWRGEQVNMNGRYAVIDIYAEANALPLDDNSQDFIASSHVLEHIPDLIGALLEFKRVMKDGAILFSIVPKHDARVEDAERPISTIADFQKAHDEKWTADTVPADIMEAGGGRRMHTWVFTLESLKALVAYVGDFEVIAEEETDSKANNGHTVVARLRKPTPTE